MFGFLRPQIHDAVERQIQDVRAEPIATRALSGLNCDTLEIVAGEFGFSPHNPIPVNGVGGVFRYLGKLLNPDGNINMFHRLGSFSSNACQNLVDGFEVVGNDGSNWDVIFLSMYHPRRSNRTPSGYRFKQYNKALGDLPVAFGSWDYCKDFPCELARTSHHK